MGVVRIDDDLQKEILKIISKKGNKYQFPSITAFINSAIYDKIQKEDEKEGTNGSK